MPTAATAAAILLYARLTLNSLRHRRVRHPSVLVIRVRPFLKRQHSPAGRRRPIPAASLQLKHGDRSQAAACGVPLPFVRIAGAAQAESQSNHVAVAVCSPRSSVSVVACGVYSLPSSPLR